MSLLPFLYDMDPWGYRPRRLTFSNLEPYDMGITPEEIRALIEFPRLRFNPQSNRGPGGSGDSCPVSVGKDGFQACVDVKQFRPSEISVKTIGDTVVIEGKHEERQDDHGYISRHFVRKYSLPKGYDPTLVVSTLSSDGVLTVSAPPPGAALEGNERVVQVQQTGPAHLNVKENPKKENPKEEKKK